MHKLKVAIREAPLTIVLFAIYVAIVFVMGTKAVLMNAEVSDRCSTAIETIVRLEPSLENIDRDKLSIEDGALMYGNEKLSLGDLSKVVLYDYWKYHSSSAVYDQWTNTIIVSIFGFLWMILMIDFVYNDWKNHVVGLTIVEFN